MKNGLDLVKCPHKKKVRIAKVTRDGGRNESVESRTTGSSEEARRG